MSGTYIVYGQRGTGSVPVEAALTLLGLPYRLIERIPEERPGVGDMTAEAMARINPMRQVPAVELPGGELMTECAAILTHLADTHPDSRLSPGVNDLARPAFLRWMAFVASQVYALVWIRDDPSRLVDDPAGQRQVMDRTRDRIAHCWEIMGQNLSPGQFLLGDSLSVLDLCVTMESYWGPGRDIFRQRAPNLWPCVERCENHPLLQALWRERLG